MTSCLCRQRHRVDRQVRLPYTRHQRVVRPRRPYTRHESQTHRVPAKLGRHTQSEAGGALAHSVAVVFVYCMPYNVCSLKVDLLLSLFDVRLLPFTIVLGHSNSALNPVICFYLNRSFRNSLRRILLCKTQRSANAGAT